METRLPRKLTVILHADVVGYSRLAGENEDVTHRQLKDSLNLIDNLISRYHGHIINTAGDAVLAVFDAAFDSVACAAAIQRDLSSLNHSIPDERKLLFRIGVNLGDVIEDEGNIYGDGVNVAARLEGLAEPGGICLSEQVYLAVRGKLGLDYEDLGLQSVKNISEPIRAYRAKLNSKTELPQPSGHQKPIKSTHTKQRIVGGVLAITVLFVGVLLAWLKPWQPTEEPASVGQMAFPIPDEPSIAVLPFVNLSGDAEKDYFIDGFSEDLITGLSQFSELFVIAKSSSFSYKNKQVKIKQVAEDLGIRFVLDGSVRMTKSELLITAQLIDAISGKNIWAEKYKRPLAEFHFIQTDVLEKIVTTVAERVENIGLQISSRKQTQNLNAYDHVLQGYDLVFRWSKESNKQARKHFAQAIELDPDYARAYAGLAFSHNIDVGRNWSADRERSLEEARKASLKGISLDDNDNRPRVTLGWAYINSGQYDKGIAELNKGIKLNPNDAGVLARSGYALIYYGEFQQAKDQAERAMRINPFHPDYYYDVLGSAEYFLKRYDDALSAVSQIVEPRMSGHRTLAAIYARMGDMENAQYHTQQILQLEPEFTLSNYAKSQPFQNPVHLEFHLESLRLAGLPEDPLITLPDKPSIAVLPFTNLSDDASQEYFASGLAEDLITKLSLYRELFVIARNSTLEYKDNSPDVKQIGRELGVAYLVQGSVRRDKDNVRINVHLIDVHTGNHIWAEKFDRLLTDVFAIQDEITQAIAGRLAPEITKAGFEKARYKKAQDLDAWDLYLQANSALSEFNAEALEKSISLAEKAIATDPTFAAPYIVIARAKGWQYFFRWTENPEQTLEQAIENAQTAIRLDNENAMGYSALGYLNRFHRNETIAVSNLERAVELNPNDATIRLEFAHVLDWFRLQERALPQILEAIRLSPRDPRLQMMFFFKAHILFHLGDFQASLEASREMSSTIISDSWRINYHLVRAANLAELEQPSEAIVEIASARKINPKLSLNFIENLFGVANNHPDNRKSWLASLRKAGMPEQ